MNLKNKIMIIDFDNTLITTDSLFYTFYILAINFRISVLIRCLVILLLKGKLSLKRYMYETNLMILSYNFNSKVLGLFKKNNAVLVSASYEPFLKKVLRKRINSKKIIGSRSYILKGRRKATFISNNYGYKNFNYIGDSFSDISCWLASYQPYTVRRLYLYKFFVPNLKHINEIL